MPATSVHDLCQKRDVTFDQLVESCGLEASRVRAIYLGRWTPSPAERQAIASVFDVSADQVAWGHKTPIQHIYGHGPG